MSKRDQATLRPYSQEHTLHVHPSGFNQPGSEAETGCVSKVDHSLGEGVGETVHVGLFLRVPASKRRRKKLMNDDELKISLMDVIYYHTCTAL